MMINVGKRGEQIAQTHLRRNGYLILGRNIRCRGGEIDIIARDIDGVLVFCEVKTLKKGSDLMPEDNVTKSKIRKMKQAAREYLSTHIDAETGAGWRIDVCAVILDTVPMIRYYRNVY